MKGRAAAILLLAAAAVVTTTLWRSGSSAQLPAPPRLDAAGIRDCPSAQVVTRVTTDLRFVLARDPDALDRWRRWPPPARTVLAIAWIESDQPPGIPATFPGFTTLLALDVPNMASLAEIAEAYRRIDAEAVAAIIDAAARRADDPAVRSALASDPGAARQAFADLDRHLIAALTKGDTMARLRSYIRTEADTIAAVER